MYYINGKDQSAIAKEIGVTRSMVSRMLTEARGRGIVEIRIIRALNSEYELEEELQHRFGIDKMFVVSVRSVDADRLLVDLGRAGAFVLNRYLEPGMVIGLAWGTTISVTVDAIEPRQAIPCRVVQLVGALGARNDEYDGHALVQRLAEKLGGESYFLNAPYLCKSPEIARAIMETQGIREVVEMGKQVHTALLGIGTTEIRYSSYYLAGYVEVEQIDRLRNAGVVGDIAGNHFDINGNFFQDDFSSRLVTIRLEDLLKIPVRIGVAGGPGKVKPIIGALRSKLVNVLVTDSNTARSILEYRD
jgi:DNA-binding transcriptional regulator LsrR (DeoR family)